MKEPRVDRLMCINLLNNETHLKTKEAIRVVDYFEEMGLYWLMQEFILTQLEEEGRDAFGSLAAELEDEQ